MAKNSIIIFALFLTFLGFCIIKFYPLIEKIALEKPKSDTVYVIKYIKEPKTEIKSTKIEIPTVSTVAKVSDIREKIRQTYIGEIGVKEATGNNDGSRIEEYQRSANVPKNGAWCAAFVCWTFQQHNIKVPISGWSPSWFPESNVIYTHGKNNNQIPQTADVGGIYYPEKKRIAHTFFIDEWQENKGNCITVEGNYTNKVVKQFRLKSQIYKVSRWL